MLSRIVSTIFCRPQLNRPHHHRPIRKPSKEPSVAPSAGASVEPSKDPSKDESSRSSNTQIHPKEPHTLDPRKRLEQSTSKTAVQFNDESDTIKPETDNDKLYSLGNVNKSNLLDDTIDQENILLEKNINNVTTQEKSQSETKSSIAKPKAKSDSEISKTQNVSKVQVDASVQAEDTQDKSTNSIQLDTTNDTDNNRESNEHKTYADVASSNDAEEPIPEPSLPGVETDHEHENDDRTEGEEVPKMEQILPGAADTEDFAFNDIQPGQVIQESGYLLPALTLDLSGRKCLVLDLDETLVHSSFKYLRQADFVIPVEIDGQVHTVYVIKRPGVDEFIETVGKLFEVVVFTASVSRYGDPLLDILDTHSSIHHRLFRESCYTYQGNYIKNLSQLGRPLKDIIILDNSPASYVFHPQHAVPISSWFSDMHDCELGDILPILKDLAKQQVDDVSVVLDVTI